MPVNIISGNYLVFDPADYCRRLEEEPNRQRLIQDIRKYASGSVGIQNNRLPLQAYSIFGKL
jgi:hypothetical protein